MVERTSVSLAASIISQFDLAVISTNSRARPEAFASVIARPRKLLGFRLDFENAGSSVALGDRHSEFQPHECAGGIAGCRTVIAFLEIGDHGEICVGHQWIEIETVVTCDQGDRFADVSAAPFDLAADPVDVFHRSDFETRLARASSPSRGTNAQCPPTTRFTRSSCASRFSPRSFESSARQQTEA
jgi:hypothetical protein